MNRGCVGIGLDDITGDGMDIVLRHGDGVVAVTGCVSEKAFVSGSRRWCCGSGSFSWHDGCGDQGEDIAGWDK